MDDQLTSQFKHWLRDETKGLQCNKPNEAARLTSRTSAWADDRPRYAPTLSRIFLWYGGDFQSRGGAPAYAATYAPEGVARNALENGAVPAYFEYDWSLNTQ